jgi:hypothetical protein
MRMTSFFLCSFRPLRGTAAGRAAVADWHLPPFIDGSCRREPDFQSPAPSISTLCRSALFAPLLRRDDRVAYITKQARYDGELGWALVALITVVERFESHESAAAWYQALGHAIPSNCIVAGNLPQPYHLTNQRLPKTVAARVDAEMDPQRAVRLWDAIYARRTRKCAVFLACRADYLELQHPRILRHRDVRAIFGYIPNTQYPPEITPEHFAALANLASCTV